MEEKLHVVDSMTATVAKFKKGGEGNISSRLRASLAWIRKIEPTFNPSQHCRISLKEKDDSQYLLTCDSHLSAKPEKPAWTKDVPKSQVVDPKPEVKKEV